MSRLRDRLRSNLLPHTERAFRMLPAFDRPRLLDIGCGRGVPTVRLAKLTGGTVVGVDTDVSALRALHRRAVTAGVGDRVQGCASSVYDLPFSDGSFDIVWCEGALYVLGFRHSIEAWRKLIRPGGVLVAHDEAGSIAEKVRAAEAAGLSVLGSFAIPETEWWEAYYRPASLEQELDVDLRDEVRQFTVDPERFRSAFFVLQYDASTAEQ